MKMRTLRKAEYQGTHIYIMQFEYVFQYLFAWGNEIYQHYIEATPSKANKKAWRNGLIEMPYSPQEVEQIEKVVLSGAMASIDELIRQERCRPFHDTVEDFTNCKDTHEVNVAIPLPTEA